MEAFAASSAKLFVENHSLLWPHHHTPATPHNHRRRHALRLSPPYRRNTLHVAAFSAPEPQAVVVGDEEVQPEETAVSEFRSVRVKFELRRECSFGQRFLMVGDDPKLGLWDPLNAVPLNWSDGHVWALEMDLPCNIVMKYKFILKVTEEDDVDILWQPGPDRVLETWETEKIITVSEDWENPELQIITEEDYDSQVLNELIELEGDPENHVEEELESGIVPDKSMLQSEEKEVPASAEITPSTDKAATLGRKKYARSSSGGAPVLIPGLTPLPADDTEEGSVSTSEKHISTDSSLNIPESCLKEEPANGLPIPNEGTEKWSSLYEEQEQSGNFGMQLSVIENDFQWGLRTIRQLLAKIYTKIMS